MPERSEAFDLGLEQTFGEGEWIAGVTYFDADFEDLIAFDFVTFLPQNIAAASSRGRRGRAALAGAGGQGPGRRQLHLERNRRRGDRRSSWPGGLKGAPPWTSPSGRPPTGASACTPSLVRDRIDSDGAILEDYDRFDVSAAYRIGRFEPGLRVLNLTDDDTSEIGGYGAQGRTAILSLDVDF